MEGDKFGRAVEVLRRAKLKEPRSAGAACHVAGLQLRVGDRAGARATIEAARERFPESWVVWKFDGLIHLEERGRERAQALESATLCFRRAAELANSLANRAELLLQVGTCLGHCGKPAKELAVYRQVMEMRPHHALAHLYWVQAQPELDAHDPIAGRIAGLIESAEVDRFDKRFLHYALGHLCDRSHEWAAAFRHFRQANDLRACVTQRTDLNAVGRGAEARVALYGRDRIEQFSRYGERTIAPIFVVGMPRSGTSLVEQILSSHSRVVGIGEGGELFRAAQRMPSFLSSRRAYPWCLEELSGEAVRALAEPITREFENLAGPGGRVVTKMPEDFWDLGLVAILFPKARIIHCTRHPIDTCLSCYMQNFVRLSYATSLDDLAAVYRLYLQIMAHWQTVLPPSMVLDVSYEELIRRPEETIRRLCDSCGLEFEDNCLRFHENTRRVDTASRWQVRRPLYAASIGRWEHYREFLGPLLPLAEP